MGEPHKDPTRTAWAHLGEGALQVWWHRVGPRGADHAENIPFTLECI